jgi:uncharacterized membrane protein
MPIVFEFLIGVIAGLRALMAPTMVSWGAGMGWIPLADTGLHWMGSPITRYFLSFAELGEIVNDKLPKTPSRKVPPQFITRVVMGGFSGAAIGLAEGSWIVGLVAGAAGAVVGTLGGAELRGRLVKAIGGKDLPIALLEDAIALVGGLLIVSHVK